MLPRAPVHLSKAAKAAWNQAGVYLIDRGLLDSGDLPVLEAFATAVGRLRSVTDAMKDVPPFDAQGTPHPGLRAAEMASGTVAKLGSLLGLAPMTRSRLNKAQKQGRPQPDEWDELEAEFQGARPR